MSVRCNVLQYGYNQLVDTVDFDLGLFACECAGQQHDSSWESQHDNSSQEPSGEYVLKRVFTERGSKVRLAGLREAYFGKLLQQSSVSVLQVSHRLPTMQPTIATPFCAVDNTCYAAAMLVSAELLSELLN